MYILFNGNKDATDKINYANIPTPIEANFRLNTDNKHMIDIVSIDNTLYAVSMEESVASSQATYDIYKWEGTIGSGSLPTMLGTKVQSLANAVFLLSWQSRDGNMTNWTYSDQRNYAKTFDNMKKMFDEKYVQCLEHTQIFCRDALNVIKNTDHKESFFFIDPPYYNAHMGCYDGYTLENFTKLLDLLQGIKGKFLLTTYPSEILT